MYNVKVKGEKYHELEFEFKSMEEVTAFAETVLHSSTNEAEVCIKKMKKEAENNA
mgnify:CR=1 FL=1